MSVKDRQPCSRNQPPAQRGSSLAVAPALCVCQRKAECPHVYGRSRQEYCELGLLTSEQVAHAPNAFAQSRDWEFAPSTLRLALRYADSYKNGPPPEFPSPYRRWVIECVYRFFYYCTVSTLGDSTTDYFGVGKPAIAGEERIRSLTELKWGEFEATDFGDLESGEKKLQFDFTESARAVCYVSSFLLRYTCLPRGVAVSGGKTDHVDRDRFLIYWFLAHGCST